MVDKNGSIGGIPPSVKDNGLRNLLQTLINKTNIAFGYSGEDRFMKLSEYKEVEVEEFDNSNNEEAIEELERDVRKLNSKVNTINPINEAIPSGSIIMWSGTTLPSGWLICDGTNGTIDLTNQFVLGGTTGNVGDINSGVIESDGSIISEDHTLTVDEIPSHSHSEDSVSITATEVSSGTGTTVSSVSINNTDSGDTGGELAHNHKVEIPYTRLIYIMKS